MIGEQQPEHKGAIASGMAVAFRLGDDRHHMRRIDNSASKQSRDAADVVGARHCRRMDFRFPHRITRRPGVMRLIRLIALNGHAWNLGTE